MWAFRAKNWFWDRLGLSPYPGPGSRGKQQLTLESLEDRVTPALLYTTLHPLIQIGPMVSVSQGGNNLTSEQAAPTSLSGTVFQDSNNDGIQQPGEPGVPGVTVGLSLGPQPAPPGEVAPQVVILIARATTGFDGQYSLNNLQLSNSSLAYTLEEGQPVLGFHLGIVSAGFHGGTVGPNGTVANIELKSGDEATGYNFGEIPDSGLSGGLGFPNPPIIVPPSGPPATLSGIVFRDSQNKGVQQGDDPGIAGITVEALWQDHQGPNGSRDGTFSHTTFAVTDANGHYTFPNLEGTSANVSDYELLLERVPAGYQQGKISVGSDGGTATSSGINTITLNPGDNATGYDFAEIPLTG